MTTRRTLQLLHAVTSYFFLFTQTSLVPMFWSRKRCQPGHSALWACSCSVQCARSESNQEPFRIRLRHSHSSINLFSLPIPYSILFYSLFYSVLFFIILFFPILSSILILFSRPPARTVTTMTCLPWCFCRPTKWKPRRNRKILKWHMQLVSEVLRRSLQSNESLERLMKKVPRFGGVTKR